MSKPPPPDQRPASYDDNDEDASLKQELQHAMAVSRHQDEKSYYDDSIYKPIGIDDQHTHTTSFPPPFTKMPANTSQSIGSSLPNSSLQSYTDHSHTTTPSPLSVNRSSPSSYDESIPNVSAYFLYQNATREHFKSIHPRMSQGELSKYISQRYKSLDPQEKAAWTAQASQANAAKLSASAEKGANVLVTPQKVTPRRKRKDPNAPKRAVGAYVFFTKDERPKILEEFKGIKFAEMGKLLGERWRGLDPDEKRKYEILAGHDRERLQSELKVYKESQSRLQKAKQHRIQQQHQHQQQQMPQMQDNQSPSQGLPYHPVVDYANGYPAYEYSDEFCSDIIKRLSED